MLAAFPLPETWPVHPVPFAVPVTYDALRQQIHAFECALDRSRSGQSADLDAALAEFALLNRQYGAFRLAQSAQLLARWPERQVSGMRSP